MTKPNNLFSCYYNSILYRLDKLSHTEIKEALAIASQILILEIIAKFMNNPTQKDFQDIERAVNFAQEIARILPDLIAALPEEFAQDESIKRLAAIASAINLPTDDDIQKLKDSLPQEVPPVIDQPVDEIPESETPAPEFETPVPELEAPAQDFVI